MRLDLVGTLLPMQKNKLDNINDIEMPLALKLARQRHPPKKGSRVIVSRISAVFAQDLLEFLLYGFGARRLTWIDRRGDTRKFSNPLNAIFRLVIDSFFWPLLYAKHRFSAWRYSSYKQMKSVSHQNVAYLRSDHIFDSKNGGAIAHMSGVVNGLIEMNCDVLMLSADQIPSLDKRVNFSEVTPIYEIGRNIPSMPSMEYTDQLSAEASRILNATKLDFIYQRYSLGNYAGVLLKHQFNVPFVCEFNGPLLWIERQWGGRPKVHEGLLQSIEDMNVKAADLIVVVSEPLAAIVEEKGIPRKRILVNPNGVDVNTFHPDISDNGVRQRYGLEDKRVIGFIGSFGSWHGAEVLAEAFGLLGATGALSNDKDRLIMIGDGNTMGEVKAQLEKYDVINKTILTGSIPQHQAAEHLAACDILVSPHVPNKDGSPFFGSPTKLFEYMAMGRGIVASNLDQIGEVLSHEKTAILVEPGNPGELAQGITMLIENESLRKKLGIAAREEAVKKYTWQLHVERILNALQ